MIQVSKFTCHLQLDVPEQFYLSIRSNVCPRYPLRLDLNLTFGWVS